MDCRVPTEAVLDLTGGVGADAALECVGTAQSIANAAAIARPGSTIGIVGVPHGQVPFHRGVLPQHRPQPGKEK
jgi:threonine dehydrogenase-like Zn-dependent dehydrogenase